MAQIPVDRRGMVIMQGRTESSDKCLPSDLA